MKLNRKTVEAFDRIGATDTKPGAPTMKKLSLLLRPAFIAAPGRTLVWGDFSNIEARVLPWLAASPGAEDKLDIFRKVDADPNEPDVYVRTAAELLGLDADELWSWSKDAKHPRHEEAKNARQSHGKVPELSLGFGGGVGALMKMAVNYGVYLDEAVADRMVKSWRQANGWAKSFWGSHGRNGSYGLWGAVNSAMEQPGAIQSVGRVAFVYDPSYLGGSLFCALPCGRLLTYPHIKWEWREVEDKETGEKDDKYQLTYMKGYGRKALWYGVFAENVTQATAASVLRRTLKRLRYEEAFDRGVWHVLEEVAPVVMHTHDEAVTEPAEAEWQLAARLLHKTMETNDEWDEGLPLAAELSCNWYYSKVVKSLHRSDYE